MLLPVAILAITAFRTYSLLRSDIWMSNRLRGYWVDRSAMAEKISRAEYYDLVRRHGGDFFPFGIKAHRLGRWAAAVRGGALHPARLILLFIRVVWSYYIFVALIGAYLISVSWNGQRYQATAALNIATAYLLVTGTVLIEAEAVICFRKVGSWGQAYHGLTTQREHSNADLYALFGTAYVTLLASTTLLFVSSSYRASTFRAFSDTLGLDRLGDSVNSAFATLVVFGDPAPATGLGKAVTDTIKLSGLIFVAFLVALVVGAIAQPPLAPEGIAARQGEEATSMAAHPQRAPSRIRWGIGGLVLLVLAALKFLVRVRTGA